MSSRNVTILIGGVVGAALGATAAWAYTQAQEGQKLQTGIAAGKSAHLQAGASEYVKIGMAVLTVIRQVADLFKAA